MAWAVIWVAPPVPVVAEAHNLDWCVWESAAPVDRTHWDWWGVAAHKHEPVHTVGPSLAVNPPRPLPPRTVKRSFPAYSEKEKMLSSI